MLEGLPESKSTFVGKLKSGSGVDPMLKNRRILQMDPNSDRYKEKSYNPSDAR